MLVAVLSSASLLILATLIKLNDGVTYAVLFRDPAASTDAPGYFGMFSQCGIVLWGLGVGALLLAVLAGGSRAGFLRHSLLITALLVTDDAFLIHEWAGDQFGGVAEKAIFAFYGIAILSYLVIHQKEILDSHYALLLVALCGFGGSIVVDMVPQLATIVDRDAMYFLEDGAKLVAIIFWTTYQVRNSLSSLRQPVLNLSN